MKIIILGAGAIGCYITAQFSVNTSHEIFLLARSSYDAISQNGIKITEAENGKISNTQRFKVTNNVNQLPQGDIIILAIKTSQNPELLPELQKICHAGTRIITLQNGLEFENTILKSLPQQILYSGTCWIKVTTLNPGDIRHDFGRDIKLGRYSSEQSVVAISPTDQLLFNLLSKAELNLELVENIRSVQLTKLALNIPFYFVAATKEKSFTEILADKTLNQYRNELQAEITTAASLLGSPIDILFIEQIVAKLGKMPVAPPTSRKEYADNMKRELPSNLDPLINLMHQHQISLPLLTQHYKSPNNIILQESKAKGILRSSL